MSDEEKVRVKKIVRRRKKKRIETRITSEEFAQNLAKIIQTQLLNARVVDASDESGSSSSCGGEMLRGKSVVINRTSTATTAVSPLRHSNEISMQSGSLLKTAMLNSSPRRTNEVFSNASATTRSSDSSPRVADSLNDTSSGPSPRQSPRSGRFFSNFRRRMTAAAPATAIAPKTVVSVQQFVADDFLFGGTLPRIASTPVFLCRVGCGGAARIYKAMIKNTVVAVKIYNQFLPTREDDIERKRLLQKLRIMSALPDHANILRTFGYRFEPYKGGERLMIAMPFVSQNLQDLVQIRRRQYYRSNSATATANLSVAPFTVGEIIDVCEQVCSGLLFMHRNNIIHRDIKCENILAMCCNYKDGINQVLDDMIVTQSDDDNDFRAVEDDNNNNSKNLPYYFLIADFDEIVEQESFSDSSSSSSLSTSSSSSALTKPNLRQRFSSNVGTVQFSAPEMIDNVHYDERVDVWSLGMIIYTMLTLELPFVREKYDSFQLRTAVAEGQRPVLADEYLEKSNWTKIVNLFERCTEKTPSYRPTTTTLLTMINDCKK